MAEYSVPGHAHGLIDRKWTTICCALPFRWARQFPTGGGYQGRTAARATLRPAAVRRRDPGRLRAHPIPGVPRRAPGSGSRMIHLVTGEKMKLARLATAAAGIVLATALAACGSSEKTIDQQSGEATSAAGGLVGVTMPTKASERWIHDGDNIKSSLENLGYTVDLQYAENDIPTQVNQIENQISKGAKLLVIASIDGTALTTQLQEAADSKIPVISYDRLIRNSPNVDYYATFDNATVGVQQATSLLTGLGLKNADGTDGTATGPFNIELFGGSPDDNNATFFFNGAMSVLKPYIDKGTLVVKSGQTDFNTVAILRWDPATAQRRMEDLLTSTYSGGATVQGVLSPYDGLSIGILSALKSNGYGTQDHPYPVVTGQDAEVASVKSIIAGEQYSTVYKDTRQLADVTVKMADAVIKGGKPEVNNTTDYDNGNKVVPSELLQPVVVDKNNYQKVLVDSGYYTADQLR
jgi:putative multiple sugar transport system substrate-binding protein